MKFWRSLFKKPAVAVKSIDSEHYQLQEIYDRINAKYFNNEVDVSIVWFGNKQARPRTRIVLGSYHKGKKRIKIHRLLDQAHIPDYFISFIVYHEMLHHVHPPIKRKNKRWQIHHPEFKLRETQFESYHLAKQYKLFL